MSEMATGDFCCACEVFCSFVFFFGGFVGMEAGRGDDVVGMFSTDWTCFVDTKNRQL